MLFTGISCYFEANMEWNITDLVLVNIQVKCEMLY